MCILVLVHGLFLTQILRVWALAAALGPLIGGALTLHGQWRWLFYLNLPVCGVAFVLVLVLLDLPTPPGSFREKLKRMDWM